MRFLVAALFSLALALPVCAQPVEKFELGKNYYAIDPPQPTAAGECGSGQRGSDPKQAPPGHALVQTSGVHRRPRLPHRARQGLERQGHVDAQRESAIQDDHVPRDVRRLRLGNG